MNPISIQNPPPLPEVPATPTRQERVVLAQMLTQLMLHWKLPIKAQCALLGLHESSKGRIYRYRRGSPLSANRDQMDRAALLLSIHANLRVLFPKNREIVYSWMSNGNKAFNGHSPVAVAQAYGIVGLGMSRRYLTQAL